MVKISYLKQLINWYVNNTFPIGTPITKNDIRLLQNNDMF